jgi:chromate transporter
MERTSSNYIKLFTACFYVSAFTFGGGYVIVPLMKKRFVDELGWIDEEDMLNMIAIAQSAPGAMAVNTSVLVGRRLLGGAGAAVALAGTVLPPFVIMSVIALLYDRFRDLTVVSAVLRGLMAGVCAVIADAVIDMAGGVIRGKRVLSIVIMSAAFVVGLIANVNVIFVIVGAGAAGVISYSFSLSRSKRGGAP